jgi:hypothetical protein
MLLLVVADDLRRAARRVAILPAETSGFQHGESGRVAAVAHRSGVNRVGVSFWVGCRVFLARGEQKKQGNYRKKAFQKHRFFNFWNEKLRESAGFGVKKSFFVHDTDGEIRRDVDIFQRRDPTAAGQKSGGYAPVFVEFVKSLGTRQRVGRSVAAHETEFGVLAFASRKLSADFGVQPKFLDGIPAAFDPKLVEVAEAQALVFCSKIVRGERAEVGFSERFGGGERRPDVEFAVARRQVDLLAGHGFAF